MTLPTWTPLFATIALFGFALRIAPLFADHAVVGKVMRNLPIEELFGLAVMERVGLHDMDARKALLNLRADCAQFLLHAQAALHQ